MKNIISFFPKEELKEAEKLFYKSKNISFSGSGNSSSKAMLVSAVLLDEWKDGGNLLWIVNNREEQNETVQALSMWGDRKVFLYSKRREDEKLNFPTSYDFERAIRVDLVEFISRIYTNKNAIFVVDFETLLQEFLDPKVLANEKYSVKVGEKLDSVTLVEELVSRGYEVTDHEVLKKGQYYQVGDSMYVFPINEEAPVRITIGFSETEEVVYVDVEDNKKPEGGGLKKLDIFPIDFDEAVSDIVDIFGREGVVVEDEIDVVDEYYEVWNSFMEQATNTARTISFTSFNDDENNHRHLHYLSVLQYRSGYDFANDLRDKISAGWKTMFFTKNFNEVQGLLRDQKVPFVEGISKDKVSGSSVFLIEMDKGDVFPKSFQAPKDKMLLLSDLDIALVRDEGKKVSRGTVFEDFLTSLKPGDFVVHADHGIARFLGLDKKTVDDITKEYLKLGYAENDKLFVPIDQADKVSKFIGAGDRAPKLTRLGSAEWNTMQSRVRKETEAIAKELLELYAEREHAKGYAFKEDSPEIGRFENEFPYEETPGQLRAIFDMKVDMEKKKPMDRLVCGDVGFGKTEVAMRAAFKAVVDKKQVAV
ncbi:MAG: CarD family transcriptional regulator, partial [Nitrospirota bacterium]